MNRTPIITVIAITALLAACGYTYPGDYVADGAAIDAAASDATLDGRPPDAPTDAPGGRTGPLVQNGQGADLVLGQASFDTNTDRGITGQSFQPEGIAFANGRLWAAEYARHRVLGWDTPSTSDQAAAYVLGQSDFTGVTTPGPTERSLFQPTGVVATGQNVAVMDGLNRVLLWTSLPTTRGQAANLVLGASTFTEAGNLSDLIAGWSDGTRLLLRRGFLRARIVVWAQYPTTSGAAPDLELLTAFEPTARNFGAGGGITSDGVRLVAADTVHNRILIWNTIPTASGQPADIVLGQPNFVSDAAGNSASGMSAPQGVMLVDGALLVADAGNDRVLVFDPLPTSSGAAATQALGQVSPSGALHDQPPSATTLNEPFSFARAGRKLFVADRGNRRILRYDLALP